MLKVFREDISRPQEAVHQNLLSWLDGIPFSRQKRSPAADFSDAVLAAEIFHHFQPKLVNMHNYSKADSLKQKEQNWLLLNRRVLRDISVDVAYDVIRDVIVGRAWAAETILLAIQVQLQRYLTKHRSPGGAGDGIASLRQTKNFDFRSALSQFSGGGNIRDRMMAAYGASTCLDTGLGTGFGASPRGAKGFKEDLSHPQFDTAGYLGMHNLENSRPLPGIDRGAQLSQRDLQGHRRVRCIEQLPVIELKIRENILNEREEIIQRLQLRVTRLHQASHIKDVQIDKLVDRIGITEKAFVSAILKNKATLDPESKKFT